MRNVLHRPPLSIHSTYEKFRNPGMCFVVDMPCIFSLFRGRLRADLLIKSPAFGGSLPLLAPISHSPMRVTKSPVYHSTSSLIVFTFLISDYLCLSVNKYFRDCCDNQNISTRIDYFRGDMARWTTNRGGPLFALWAVVLPLVSLHDSNAHSNTVFSMVKKTDIYCRSDLSQETIRSLLSCKLNTGGVSVLFTGKMS